jgi:hypothetical protein
MPIIPARFDNFTGGRHIQKHIIRKSYSDKTAGKYEIRFFWRKTDIRQSRFSKIVKGRKEKGNKVDFHGLLYEAI